MTDELDDLNAAMKATMPSADPARRAANLANAQEIFARSQGTATDARPTVERGLMARLTKGAKQMQSTISKNGALAATTAVAAVAIFFAVPQGWKVMMAPPVDLAAGQASHESVEREEARSTSLRRDRAAGALTKTEAPQPAPALQAEVGALSDAAPMLAEEYAATSAEVRPPRRQAPQGIAAAIDPTVTPEQDTEAYPEADPNELEITRDDPVSTFSIDVDTTSYAVVRSSLMAGRLPPAAAVRVEEMVNYFPYAYTAPDGDAPFRPTISVVPTPWNEGTELVHIGIQGTLPSVEDRPPLNLVFLIDTSGSMQDSSKLPLLKQSFRLMLSELRPEDEVSIVTYAGSAGQVLEPTRAAERSTVLAALDNLEAGGSTAGQAGLQQAYSVAEGMAFDGEVTRVILATDGDFNVGLSDPDALKDFIAKKRDSGAYLSVLGFGRGNLDDATMQALAQNGNGTASYIDTLNEARKVLVDNLTGALFPIANDVKIQVEFNPGQVAEYRLIGYETRSLRRQDFNNDKVDAGDIGAGHTVTAIYEITPVGSEAVQSGSLRYATEEAASVSDELGFFKLRYKHPGEADSRLIEQAILPGMGEQSDDVRFSAAIAGFGQLLTGGEHLGGWGYAEAIDLANSAKGEDAYGYRAEAVNLMRLASSLDQ